MDKQWLRLKKSMIEEEFRDSDGYWIYLKPGFKNATDPLGNLHIFHEDTRREAAKGDVMLCDCEECTKLKDTRP
jgi:hypothetical protein